MIYNVACGKWLHRDGWISRSLIYLILILGTSQLIWAQTNEGVYPFGGTYLNARIRTPEGPSLSTVFFQHSPSILELSLGVAGGKIGLGLGHATRSNSSLSGYRLGLSVIRTWGRPWGPEHADEFYYGIELDWYFSFASSMDYGYLLNIGIYSEEGDVRDETYVCGGAGLGITL